MPRERRERAMPGARGRPARRSSRNLGGDGFSSGFSALILEHAEPIGEGVAKEDDVAAEIP